MVGTGREVAEGAEVEVHYVGQLADGTVFDASRERGTPFSFRLGQGAVIEGWELGLRGMREGGTRRIVIPPELGYGDRDLGTIPPNSTLFFEVELLAVEPPREAPALASDVADEAWDVRGPVRVADLETGTGAGFGCARGQRVCLDYASFDMDGVTRDHTYGRSRCTWYRLAVDDLVPGIEEGLRGMRAGGSRAIRAGDEWFEVRVDAVGR